MRIWIGACALLWSVSVSAFNRADVNQSLTLPAAIASVLENNPQLLAADFDSRAAAARIRRETQTKPWKLGLELENLGGTGRNDGISQLETTLSLGRILELGDKPTLRGEVSRTEAALLRNETDAKRLDLMAETAARFIAIVLIQGRRELARERIGLRQETVDVVERRFRLGKTPAAELSRARIDLARAELALEETDHQLAASRRNLAVLWGELMPKFQQVRGDLYALESVPDAATLDQLVEQNPILIRFATRQRLAETRLRLAEASRQPDVEFSGGVKHYNGADDFGMVFSVGIPLGSRSRARPRLDELAALAEKEPLLARDKRLALRATLFGLRQELSHARHVMEITQERIIPSAQSALADYTKGYAAGRYSLLELTQAQDTLLQARIEVLNAAADYQRNRIDIDRLTGGALSRYSAEGVTQ